MPRLSSWPTVWIRMCLPEFFGGHLTKKERALRCIDHGRERAQPLNPGNTCRVRMP
jgi:hypothetical protein